MFKKTAHFAIAILLVVSSHLKANEGMWLPFLINDVLYEEMQDMGLQLSREQIFSLNESSLKDAIVSFGGGCTAEMISAQGLLLTNHHCGYSRIAALSSPEHNYLADGFWAMSHQEELPSPGLFVRFLVSVSEVTKEVEKVLDPAMSVAERTSAISKISEQLVEEATKGTHYIANVRPMFAENEFFLFVYERFDDVRLVGTPPSSIGKFGGDTDNWMWPRHTGDFSLFRVYTAPDGTPAAYSPENVPLQPRHHLPVSIKGVKEGDFAMVLGFPGSTDRYLTSWGINYMLETELPVRIKIRRQKLDIIEEGMASSVDVRIKYASRQSGISNYWKNFIGMSNSLKRHNVAAEKTITERTFQAWVMHDPLRRDQFGDVLSNFKAAYEGLNSFKAANFVFTESIATGPIIAPVANGFEKLESLLKEKAPQDKIDAEVESLRAIVKRSYLNYNRNIEKKMWAAMISTYYENMPEHLRPEIYTRINKSFKGNYNRFADHVYSKSIFAEAASLEKFLEKPSLKVLEKDWAYQTIRALYIHAGMVRNSMSTYEAQLANARRMFIKGLKEMNQDKFFYPDANSTMRFTYGSVQSYQPADGVTYHYTTTLSGVMEKENPDHHEFLVPRKLVELYKKRDFGPYGSGDQLIVNFITDNDITGGNSGSPVLDANGHLIGLAFDGNWESMSGDILFEKRMQRCINMDARYILFIIDKFAGATHLIEEMTIIK